MEWLKREWVSQVVEWRMRMDSCYRAMEPPKDGHRVHRRSRRDVMKAHWEISRPETQIQLE